MLCCSQIENPITIIFPHVQGQVLQAKHWGGQCLTLGESMMQNASEVGCEVLKTGQMIFLSGLFHCYCVSPGLDTAAENKQTKIKRWHYQPVIHFKIWFHVS